MRRVFVGDIQGCREELERLLEAVRFDPAADRLEPVGDFVGRFVYPNRHRYSALFALDYFREAALHDGTPPDARLADAIALVRSARQPDGCWLQTTPLAGRTWFAVDVPEGEASKWLTLLGTRVLDWWDAAH